MNNFSLMNHQQNALELTDKYNKCAYYLDMGLGKTFVGAEKMKLLNNNVNLVICQKSKVDDWIDHFIEHYPEYHTLDLTKKNGLMPFMSRINANIKVIGVINYELAFRRPELKKLKGFTLMLDESSMIQNEQAKRSKFILSLNHENVILLSGTPTSGKYERLWSQLKLLGWNISKKRYWDTFVETRDLQIQGMPFPIKKIVGYKNVDRLKEKLKEHGAVFMKTEEVFDLPEQIEQIIKVPSSKDYRKFKKDCIVNLRVDAGKNLTKSVELVGDTSLTKMLYERQLCGMYSKEKLDTFNDLLESTNDRLIVFYNFTGEYKALLKACTSADRAVSTVNGDCKDLEAYENIPDSVTLIQYQAGAMGLNLQKANKAVYFSPPVSCELFMQSKKRTHRIGQAKTCFYYYLTCQKSIEEKIYKALEKGTDYTDKLFVRGE